MELFLEAAKLIPEGLFEEKLRKKKSKDLVKKFSRELLKELQI